jgi:hypothetical protein
MLMEAEDDFSDESSTNSEMSNVSNKKNPKPRKDQELKLNLSGKKSVK